MKTKSVRHALFILPKPKEIKRTTAEYKDVLLRSKFPFVEAQITAIIDQIVQNGVSVTPVPLPHALSDTDEEIFFKLR